MQAAGLLIVFRKDAEAYRVDRDAELAKMSEEKGRLQAAISGLERDVEVSCAELEKQEKAFQESKGQSRLSRIEKRSLWRRRAGLFVRGRHLRRL